MSEMKTFLRHGMSKRTKLMVARAALPALALPIAPTAQARPVCDSAGATTVCSTNGSTSIHSRPGTTAPQFGMPAWGWLGGPGQFLR